MLQEHESGWWKGERKGVIGLFPVTYCEECVGPLAEEEKLSVSDADAPAQALLALAAQEAKLRATANKNGALSASDGQQQPFFSRRGVAASEYVGGRRGAQNPSPAVPMVASNPDRMAGLSKHTRPPPPLRTKSAGNVAQGVNIQPQPNNTTTPTTDKDIGLAPLPSKTPPVVPPKVKAVSLEDTRTAMKPAPAKKLPPPVPSSASKPNLTTSAPIPASKPPPKEEKSLQPAITPSPTITTTAPTTNNTSTNNNTTGGDLAKQLEAEKAKNAELEKTILNLRKELEGAKAGGGSSNSPNATIESLRAELANEKRIKEDLQRSSATLLEEIVKLKSAERPPRPSQTSPAPSRTTQGATTQGNSPKAPPHRRRPQGLGRLPSSSIVFYFIFCLAHCFVFSVEGGSGLEANSNGTASPPRPGNASPTDSSGGKDVEARLAEALQRLEEEAEARKSFEAKILSELSLLKNGSQ